MRRAIAAAVVGGVVLGGALAAPSVAAARGAGKGPGKARPAASAQSRAAAKSTAAGKSRTGMKTVIYEGYEFLVPASWPVYRLAEHPRTCVRYDVHAVYLGTPGTNMRCPAGLVGRTQTISFIPSQARPGAGSPGRPAAPHEAGDTEVRRLPAVHSTITENAVQHKLEVRLAVPPGSTVLATYGTDPAVVERVLGTLRPAPAGAAPTAKSKSASSQPGASTSGTSRRAKVPGRAHLTPRPASAVPRPSAKASPGAEPSRKATPPAPTPEPTYSNWRGVPTNWPVQIVQPTALPTQPGQPTLPPVPPTPPVSAHPVGGFDTCTAPPTSTMRAWRTDYAAVGVYIGGANAACAKGNLSASWVKSADSMGWGMLPIYVGPQAPCWNGHGVAINPASAAAQGKAAALDAVSDARSFGFAAGSPVYYDMEGYNIGTSCTNAVLAFLGAWDAQMEAAGYVTGVYSSRSSGIADLQTATAGNTAGFTPPVAIWDAHWDNVPLLTDGSLAWPLTDRTKQYAGNVNGTVQGITLNIDKDIVGGPVAH